MLSEIVCLDTKSVEDTDNACLVFSGNNRCASLNQLLSFLVICKLK